MTTTYTTGVNIVKPGTWLAQRSFVAVSLAFAGPIAITLFNAAGLKIASESALAIFVVRAQGTVRNDANHALTSTVVRTTIEIICTGVCGGGAYRRVIIIIVVEFVVAAHRKGIVFCTIWTEVTI